MSRAALLTLLQTRLGLDPSSLGTRVLDDACTDARRDLGAADDDALFERVVADADAFAQCAEWFVVPETWFFRAREQFTDLARYARSHPERRPLRVLSLPCSTGEEAYSAAITLLEAGLAPSEIEILGIDVSRAVVLRAQAGSYRPNALRGQPLPTPWLHEAPDGTLVVDPLLRRCVRFRVGNAVDLSLLRQEDRFDAVFCRNLLIYLLPEARRQLVQTLLAATHPGALLLAGQAEILSKLSDAISPYPGGCPLSFVHAVAKPPAVLRPPAPATPSRPRAAAVAAAPARDRTPAAARPDEASAPTSVSPPASADPMQVARQLADAGEVAPARTACLAHLALHPDDVGALYLLGLLESTAGNPDAADRAFTQVLYLDRGHLEALEQRVGLAERRGEDSQARELRARAMRLRRQREASP